MKTKNTRLFGHTCTLSLHLIKFVSVRRNLKQHRMYLSFNAYLKCLVPQISRIYTLPIISNRRHALAAMVSNQLHLNRPFHVILLQSTRTPPHTPEAVQVS